VNEWRRPCSTGSKARAAPAPREDRSAQHRDMELGAQRCRASQQARHARRSHLSPHLLVFVFGFFPLVASADTAVWLNVTHFLWNTLGGVSLSPVNLSVKYPIASTHYGIRLVTKRQKRLRYIAEMWTSGQPLVTHAVHFSAQRYTLSVGYAGRRHSVSDKNGSGASLKSGRVATPLA
jgi:hypothetical protein